MPPRYGLGRKFAADDRDHKYLLMQRPEAQQVVRIVDRSWAFFSKPIDQGQTGTCVGHGWKHRLMADPIVRRADAPPSAYDIYDAACKLDEWPDNDNDKDRQFGTSVRAGAKALKAAGLLAEYNWCYDADSAIKWLAGLNAQDEFVGGPLVIGVNWYTSMFDTDPEGILHISGNIEGGHSVCINRWIPKRGLLGGIQNWRLPWGWHGNGHFLIDAGDFDRLVKEDGECCSPTELRPQKAA